MIDSELISVRHEALCEVLNERDRRLHTASEAKALGRGGIAAVSRATGVARSTIGRGLKDLASPERLANGRVRREGGGRKPLTEADPTLICDLEALVEPDSRGDPMSPLRWTCKSLRVLAVELGKLGRQISRTVVGELLRGRGYSLHANRKTEEGCDHPDRDAQSGVINQATKEALAEGQPVISVDTKKKELVGDFKNAGREWRPKGDFEDVRVHDFLIKELGRAVPYGVYDLAANEGFRRRGYIQGKVHPKVLIDDLRRQSKERAKEKAEAAPDLFAYFNGLDLEAKTEFYQHDQHWSNGMIVGDSLSVMASPAEREELRGQVQCIYLDPPYGVKFNSNFQWSTTSRDVKDGAKDHITREPEQVRAFRDIWREGIHSYLTYLRDRLTVARDLLGERGSIFVHPTKPNPKRPTLIIDSIVPAGVVRDSSGKPMRDCKAFAA